MVDKRWRMGGAGDSQSETRVTCRHVEENEPLSFGNDQSSMEKNANENEIKSIVSQWEMLDRSTGRTPAINGSSCGKHGGTVLFVTKEGALNETIEL